MLVIYKNLKGLAVTDLRNYRAQIRDLRKVQDCSAFGSPAEVIEYYCTWFGSSKDDFLVKC